MLKRKEKALSRMFNRYWYTILLTNDPDRKSEELLALHRHRDMVEKLFDLMKNELHDNRVRVHSKESIDGRMFILFLSLIFFSMVDKAMRERKLYKSHTMNEVFLELGKVKKIVMSSGKSFLTEISKKQRTLYDYFNVPIPSY